MSEPEHNLLSSKTLPVRIIIPVSLTIVLFIMTIFQLVIPILERQMMAGKREALLHLTEAAWSTLDYYHDMAENQVLDREQAQTAAIAHLEKLRYGPELRDYFWINDMTPTMIMHPYRPDLVGKDISEFRDPSGKRLFSDMVVIVKEQGAGYADYLWQWQGDSDRIIPKISYVKGFAPWGWLIGTGLYVADVKSEISTITRQLTWACIGIMAVVLILSGVIIREAAKERQNGILALEQSRLREKQLLQADKMTSLGILTAGVAHEINNPVTALMLNAPSLKKAWESFIPVLDAHYAGNPDARVCNMPYADLRSRILPMLDAIQDGSARIKRIIAELKDFSRPGGTGLDGDVDINQVVEKSMDLTRTITRKATNHLSVSLAEELPPIAGNFQKLQQVVINLIMNASQSLENPEQAIRVRTFEEAGFIGIRIEDDGPGVDEDTLKKLKEPFFTTRRDDGGTGLGLSISEKIVNDHQGVLEFDSVPGNGFTARVLLPCRRK